MPTIVVPGFGDLYINPTEFTSEFVLDQYKSLMGRIQDIFMKEAPLTDNDYTELIVAMQELKLLAQSGDSQTIPGLTYYLDSTMIGKLYNVLVLIDSVGITVDGVKAGVDPLQAMEVLKTYQTVDANNAKISFLDVLQASTDRVDWGTQTLQNLIYLELVEKACTLYEDTLAGLEEALRMNQNVIDVLTMLQNASNQISVPNPGDFHWPVEKLEDIPAECIEAIAELLGRNSVFPGPGALPGDEFIFSYNAGMAPDEDPKHRFAETALKIFNDYVNASKENANKMLEVLTKHFENLVPIPDPSGPVTPDQLLDCAKQLQEYIQQLESEGNQLDDPSSLASSLRNVVADIEKAFEGVDAKSPQKAKDAAMSQWIMDQQNQGSAGKQTIQDNLQKAISAAQSLDDVQKEDLRQAQYVFDQVIKCAAAMMQAYTKIIEKMGQGIGRG